MRLKKLTALAMVSAMSVALAGCGSSDKAGETKKASESTGPVELNVVTTYAGEDTNAQNYQDAIAAWQKETGNTVKDASATADETFKTRVITDFETGSEPDVLFFFTGVDANAFVEQEKVVSIEDIRAEYPDFASNMKDDMLPTSPVDGKAYAVPVNGYWEGLFVNKEVLDKAGVEMPTKDTTWADFLDMCQKVKDAGFTPIAASLQEIPHYWFDYAILNNNKLDVHTTVPGSADEEIGKAWVNGLEDIKSLYEKGFYPENTLTATDAETFQLFAEDKAAFLIDGSWKVGGIEEAVDDIENFSVTHVPGNKGEGLRATTEAISGISSGYYITQKAWEDPAKREAAVKFIEYMTSDELVSKFSGTAATALKNGVNTEGLEISALGEAAVAYTSEFTKITAPVQDNLSEAQREPIFSEMAAIVKGDTSAKDAVEAVLELVKEDE
ncbi:MAG: extracellular solute-binding protein [Eubacterium sp.]|nr:extracellular solute-binding protein [Eubacterium sp.]